MSLAPPIIGKVFEERYQVVELLAEGRTSWLFRAHHQLLGFDVVVKIYRRDAVARVERELSTLFRRCTHLQHAHTARVQDFGSSTHGPYLVLELLDGKPLASRLTAIGEMCLSEVVRIVRQTAEALHEAHELELLHGAVVPRNIMLCRLAGETEYVKVIGYGVDDVLPGNDRETLWYHAPEKMSGGPVDRRSDVYSCGVILHELVVGSRPSGPDPPELGPTRGNEDVPAMLRQLVAEMLRGDPRRRPMSAAVAAERLHGVEMSLDYELRRSQLWRLPDDLKELVASKLPWEKDDATPEEEPDAAVAEAESPEAAPAKKGWWKFWK